MTEKEQKFNKDYYIIRTFEDFKIENQILISEVGRFKGLQKDILLNATGILSAREMANKFDVKIEDIENAYDTLNEKCLVYISEF